MDLNDILDAFLLLGLTVFGGSFGFGMADSLASTLSVTNILAYYLLVFVVVICAALFFPWIYYRVMLK